MALAKILLPMNSESQNSFLIETAFCLARRVGASIEALHPKGLPLDDVALSSEALTSTMIEELWRTAERRAQAEEKATHDLFAAAAVSRPDVKTRFIGVDGSVDVVTGKHARLSDLVITGSLNGFDSPFWAKVRDGAMFQSGRPVLVTPPREPDPNIGETLIIGWKDSIEAARALHASLNFIPHAKTVRLVTINGDPEAENSLAEAKAYLELHGAMVETAVLARNTDKVSEMLAAETENRRGALLIMGAFSHWRWQEWLFGGVTEQILHNGTVPALMVH
jgi:nucleotide-binding universal stress UspA family protein